MARLFVTALLVFVFMACASAGSSGRGPAAFDGVVDPSGWGERVVSRDGCLDVFHCPRFAPYYRAGLDPSWGRAYWLVSDAGEACLVAPEVFAVAADGTFVTCRWRRPRG